VVVERRVSRRRRLGRRRIQECVERDLRVDGHRASARQPYDQVGAGRLLLSITGEMGLRREIEMRGEAGRLDDLSQRGLPPLAADGGPTERIRQPARLPDKLLLLVGDTADETAQFAVVPPLADADLLDRPFELGQLAERRDRLAPAGQENQRRGASGAGD
jgi:hypothetical protein